MRGLLFSLTLLAFVATLQAAEPPTADVAARVALALAQRLPQAPVTPQAPPLQHCQCQTADDDCICDRVSCGCEACKPVKTALPAYSILVLSRSDCPPCAKLFAALNADGQGDDFPQWDVWTDSPRMEAKYGGVAAYPTILLLRDGKEVSRHVGAMSAVDMLRWQDDPDGPQSKGEAVPRATYTAGPTHRPMPMMRRFSPAFCPPGRS